MARLIKQLRLGCSPGVDGVMADHLRYGLGTTLALHISVMLTLCLQFGCVPDPFRSGNLIPILKKPHLDPTTAAHYRPITVSITFSKLLELYMLSECSDHDADANQYGFVAHRGTATAIALAHDVCVYCQSEGSQTYLCSLDAEGAFDALPHPIIFLKAANVMPDHCWRLMYSWYSNMHVRIKWGTCISDPIPVNRDTRQGGLTSPFLFNLFYEDLIAELNLMSCGISIDDHHYNVHCYADDILLSSATVSGLQRLIDCAVGYITSHGLRFNPAKSSCFSYGKGASATECYIEGQAIPQVEEMVYLGATLRNDSGTAHAERRSNSATKAFYSLQGVGLRLHGLSPDVCAKLFTTGVRTVLSYAIVCL